MQVDEQIEPLVRDALNACVHRDEARLQEALKAFPGDDALRGGLNLTFAIAVAVLVDSFDGLPTDEQLRAVSQLVSEMEEWSALTPDLVFTYLKTLVDWNSDTTLAEAIDPKTPVVMTFIITASLLSSSKKKREGEWWFDYLDRIEAQLDAMPN